MLFSDINVALQAIHIVFTKSDFRNIYLHFGILYSALTLKAPISTAAGDKFCDTFPNFWQK